MAPKSTTTGLPADESEQEDKDARQQESIMAGRKLANPPPGEEIVITGMAGRFPDSDDVEHFKNNLYDKVDMISSDERRWKHEHPEIPRRGGKITYADKFDAGFFGVPQHQIKSMDPMCRILLERSFEAILDAGYHPSELEGTRTGVYVGSCVSETENVTLFSNYREDDYSIMGTTRSVLANRISYYLKVKGPSIITDTACSSSLYSFEQAYKDLREGKCDYALVGGANLCLHPYVSLQFARLGVLSMDGSCKSFDNDANGYARSEGIVAILLQKANTARRSYARILHAKTNCDGFKEQGITYPSGEVQKVLLEDFYKECEVAPSSLSYMEAHGTGTKVGDPEELKTLDEMFCTGRDRPLLIGTVKSNIGHNEPVSGLCSIVKVIIGMENGLIPPNINFKSIRQGVEGLETERMVVVDEKMPWQDDLGLAGINSFGFGGGNSHVLLKWNEKIKVDGGLPKDDLPRLVGVCGRIPTSCYTILDYVESNPLDTEYISLLHHTFGKHIPGFHYKGYSIMTKNGEIKRSQKYYDEIEKPLVYFFGASDKKWASIGHQLFAIPKFAGAIQKIHEIYSKKGLPVNVTEIINSYQANNLAHYVIGTVSVQLALVEILKDLGCQSTDNIGYSLGSITAAYADGTITFEEAVLTAFYTSLTLTEILEKDDYKPQDVSKSSTGKHLLKYLKQVVSRPKTSESKGGLCEELMEKILTSKRGDVEPNIPENSVVVEIGTEFASKPILDNAAEEASGEDIAARINLVEIGDKDAVESFLEGLGNMYQNGVDLALQEIYPKVEFPVSRGTPMISHLIKWNHEKSWYVMNYKEWSDQFFGYKILSLTVKDNEWSHLTGHVIDGRNLFPATGYLCIIWQLFTSMWKSIIEECKVVFENVRFVRAVNIPKSSGLTLMLTIQKNSGLFEVTEGDVAVVTGRIYQYTDDNELGDYPVASSDIINDKELPLSEKDIYKELRLRGYNYSGLFRGIKKCEKDATVGMIEWKNNFTAFMDNMLQMKILQEDTRNLYVPTSINRIVIDPKSHLLMAEEMGENPMFPVYVNKYTGIIRSNFIEIRGLCASPIPRKKPMGEPVLETYKFVPNVTTVASLEESMRINVQLALENILSVKVRVVEVPHPDATEEYAYLSPLVANVLGDLPLMQPEISVFTDKQVEISGVSVDNKSLKDESNCVMVIVSDLSSKGPEALAEATKALREKGYVLSRERLESELNYNDTVDVLTVHTTDTEKLVLLKQRLPSKKRTVIEVSNDAHAFDWLPTLQNQIKIDDEIVLLAQNDPKNGILGLVNCIRREPGGDKVRAVFIQDQDVPKQAQNSDLISRQLEKGVAVNIFKDGQWGSYRHLLLPHASEVEAEHCFAVVSQPGDLSTLKWIEGHLTLDSEDESETDIVEVYYSAVNFRDIMTASGRISADIITRDRTKQMCIQGFEFAGKNRKGERVYGLVPSGALASIVPAKKSMLWKIPDNQSMEDAVTVPCVYMTVLIALVVDAKIKHGESILIHAGTGGVGQAAINIATYFGCTIFTTVGTPEKREFMKTQFPHLRDTHVGNSRDTTFEQMVMYHTKGRGVDIVLNSLAEEKLAASVRCLAQNGRFLEIGKFDLASDNQLALQIFEKGATFRSVMLDMVMNNDPYDQKAMGGLLKIYHDNGSCRPLPRKVFKQDELEQAFRYMASGKHMGKVILKLRDEDEVPAPRLFKCYGRYYCDSEKTIVIVGGLGGFGLELADWLIMRQARKVILTSRKGVTTGYQAMRIRNWKSYGVDVEVYTDDVTKKEECVALLEKANKMGPVQAIFNLGVVLKDSILDNQTVDDYRTSFAPKAYATDYLDELTRKMCPELRDFVIFSSVSCGRGNAGQTNYGMANSVMERICENRKKDGYPGLAIEWGAVGDVGLVAEMQESNTELVIGGTLQQRITSCLSVLDNFLRQDDPIVSSMVVAEKRGGAGNFDNAIDAIANILGLRDIKIVSPHQTLPELGMDSIMAVEIKQILESEYEIVLTPQEIRGMTFARIQELEKEKESGESKKDSREAAVNAFKMFLTHIGPASEEEAAQSFIKMKSLVEDGTEAPTVIMIPGIEGYAIDMDPLAKNLKMNAVCLQYHFDGQVQDIKTTAKNLLPTTKQHIGADKVFRIIGYSYGVMIGLELINLLEEEGYTGSAIFIDGAPDVMKEICLRNLVYDTDATFDTSVLCGVMSLYLPVTVLDTVKLKMLQCNTYQERVQTGVEYVPKDFEYPVEYLVHLTSSFYERVKSVNNYKKSFEKIEAPVRLIRPTMAFVQDFAFENYRLTEYCKEVVDVVFAEGDHVTVLQNEEVANHVHDFFLKEE